MYLYFIYVLIIALGILFVNYSELFDIRQNESRQKTSGNQNKYLSFTILLIPYNRRYTNE